MKGRARDQRPVFPPIQEVPGKGVAEIGHVDPNLVGSAGIQLQTEEGAATVGGQHSIARAGRLAVWADHLLHQRPVLRPQRGADEAGGGLRPAFTDRQIGPSESLCVELAFQNLLGMRVFGRHQQAGGATVQPMDRVKVRRISLQIVMPEQKITQSIITIRSSSS